MQNAQQKEYFKKINKLNAHYLPIYTYKYLFNFLGHPKRKYIMEPLNICTVQRWKKVYLVLLYLFLQRFKCEVNYKKNGLKLQKNTRFEEKILQHTVILKSIQWNQLQLSSNLDLKAEAA